MLSSSVRSPIPGLAVSNGLRPGLAMVAKSMADELGARNVRVNGLLPGRIDTDRLRELDERTGRPGPARRDSEARIPLGRYGRPEEFGRVAAFVLSPAASYLSGAMVPVDGGAIRALLILGRRPDDDAVGVVRSTCTLELGAVELGVEPAGGEQLVVAAPLDDAAVVDDEDLVGLAHRRQPVGDHERGAAGQRRRQRPLHGRPRTRSPGARSPRRARRRRAP